MRWLIRSAVLTTVAGAGLVLAVPASAAGGWRAEPTPHGAGISLAGVSCAGLSRCVAVGGRHAEGWNGRSWAVLPAPGRVVALAAIACPSASFCVAVGSSTGNRAAAWSWNGHGWKSLAVPNPASADNVLSAVRCASAASCEAVGAHGDASFAYPLAESWNGRRWTRQSTTGAPQGTLDGVACQKRSSCEAVGADRAGPGITTLAMHWDGSRWRTQRTPVIPPQHGSLPGEPYQFSGVSCWPSGCTAVGTALYCACSPESSGYILLAERWNGSRWKLQGKLGSGVSPDYNSASWNAVHCSKASSCTAAGEWTIDNEAQPYQTLISRWDGSKWRQVTTPSPNADGNLLNAIACTSSACTAVGVQGGGDSESGDSLALRN